MISVEKWETHCDDCGCQLIPDRDWRDERHCVCCNTTYMDPNAATTKDILRRLEARQ